MSKATETKNAIIRKACLSNADYGLTGYLHLDYGGVEQGFGGYALLTKGGDCCGHFVNRCLEIADVTEWSKLKGKTIRVKSNGAVIHSIGHIVNDDWFCPKEDWGHDES